MSIFFNYSVRRAITGSFLLAILAGINPAITVNKILIIISINPATKGREAILLILRSFFTIILIGKLRSNVSNIPNNPALNPSINVSALNTLEISFFISNARKAA